MARTVRTASLLVPFSLLVSAATAREIYIRSASPVVAYAQSHQNPAKHEGVTKNEQRGTEDKPFAVKLVPSDEAKAAAKQDKEDRDAKRKSDQDLAKYTSELADYTNDLSRYTKSLVVIGAIQGLIFVSQLIAFWYQGRQLKRTVDTAVMESMPVLSPRIVGGILHPLSSDDQPVIFTSSVHLVFENYGKTPAMIRDLRMDLFLNERDEFPAVEFETLPRIAYAPIIGGDSRGENALMGAAEYTKRITLTGTEFGELLAEASGQFRRFDLIGQVIYDDFFENRHTRRFCVKMRRMGEGGLFQLVRGGREYNQVHREQVPQNDPLATTPRT